MRLLREETVAYFLAVAFFLVAFFLLTDVSLKALFVHASLLLFSMAFFKKRIRALILPKSLKEGIIESAICFFSLLMLSIALGVFFFFFSANYDLYKVSEKITAFTPLLIFTALLIAPFSEELFFRGFLVEKMGILPAAVVFALAHYAYGSQAEIVGAFFLGIVLGYFYKRNKNLFANIIAHLLFNLLSISLAKFAYNF